ncbi:hypothetical protein RB594_004696 [Gaeumannomyces avenae]
MDSDLETTPPAEKPRGWAAELSRDVSMAWADIPLLASCFVSGICESITLTAASVFVSMQTGNTLYLALGAARIPVDQPLLWVRCLASMGAFWAGCLAFSHAARLLGPRRKLSLALSFLLQSALVCAAAAVAQSGAVPTFAQRSLGDQTAPERLEVAARRETDPLVVVPIVLLAFQFGGQIVASRSLGFNEVPTNVLTSVYCDLLSDPKILAPPRENPKRNRRVAAVVLLAAGGLCGGFLQRSKAGMGAALWVAAAVKMAIAVAWLAWKGQEDPRAEKR